MAIRISIPTPLRPYADNARRLEVDALDVAQALGELTRLYPALRQHLFDTDGTLRPFVNIYRNDEDIRQLSGDRTPVSGSDPISIINRAMPKLEACWDSEGACEKGSRLGPTSTRVRMNNKLLRNAKITLGTASHPHIQTMKADKTT